MFEISRGKRALVMARVGVNVQVGTQVDLPHDQRQSPVPGCPPASKSQMRQSQQAVDNNLQSSTSPPKLSTYNLQSWRVAGR